MSELRFLCDAMLAGLGRRLRMAGYDTEIERGRRSDHELLLHAADAGRIFLTLDRRIHEHKAARDARRVMLLTGPDERAWARQLTRGLGVRWGERPLTRCLQCNSPLLPLPGGKHPLIPADVNPDKTLWCPRCEKPFWPGSHVKRMLARLNALDESSRREQSEGE